MTAIDDIKAGEYVVTALFWDQITSKPGQPFDFTRHRKGDTVDLNVEDARRLVLAGAVVKDSDVGKLVIPGRMQSAAPGETPEPLPGDQDADDEDDDDETSELAAGFAAALGLDPDDEPSAEEVVAAAQELRDRLTEAEAARGIAELAAADAQAKLSEAQAKAAAEQSTPPAAPTPQPPAKTTQARGGAK